jgi:hypothetical protein
VSEEKPWSPSAKVTCKADLVQLAEATGRPQKDLFAMAAATDPFNADREGRREWAEWFAAIYVRLKIPRGAHLRRMHYRMISEPEPIMAPNGKAYVNTFECFHDLIEAGRDARYLDLIPRGHISISGTLTRSSTSMLARILTLK